MSKDFPDHFSNVSAGYLRYRPRYPAALFSHLAAVASARDLAWDCATGNGQAAVLLAPHFRRVIATDASSAQIAQAEPGPGVEYRVAKAEESGLEAASVDLLMVAQALHWFDLPRFFAEAWRVLRPGGLLVACCYDRLRMDPPVIERILSHFYENIVGPYWPPERRWIEEGYQSIALPGEPVEMPAFAIETRLTRPDLLGYLGTWSATQRYRETLGQDPLPALDQELAPHWGPADEARPVVWPLTVRVTRQNGP